MTGGYGCIGSWVAKQLTELGEEVWIYDLTGGSPSDGPSPRRRPADRDPLRAGRYVRPLAFQQAVDRVEATHLLHLAGLQTPTCRANPSWGPRSMSSGLWPSSRRPSAERAGRAGRLRQLRGRAWAGRPGAADSVADEVRLVPVTHYGAFKVCNELNARVYWLDHGISSVGLRPWTVYGVGRDFGMTSEPTKAIKSVAAGRPYRISYGGNARPPIRPRRRRDFPPCPVRPLLGGRRLQHARSRRPDRGVRERTRRGRPRRHGTRHPWRPPPADCSRPRRHPARCPPRPDSPHPVRDGIAETYRRFAALRDQGKLD